MGSGSQNFPYWRIFSDLGFGLKSFFAVGWFSEDVTEGEVSNWGVFWFEKPV